MRVVLLSLFAVQVLGAPVLDSGAAPVALKPVEQGELIREKRSSYAAPMYAQSPCGAPISAAPPSNYAFNIPHYNPQPAYPSYGIPQLPHYRSDDFEEDNEMMNFSEMNHMPMARYGYAPAQYGAPIGNMGHLLASGSGGAVGLFPNANVGGCAVPLLLSCSPSITHGRLLKSHQAQPQYAPAAAPVQPAYRVDEQVMAEPHHEEHHHHESLLRHHDESQGLQTSHEQQMAVPHDATHLSGMNS